MTKFRRFQALVFKVFLTLLVTMSVTASIASAETLVGVPVWDIELSKYGGVVQGPIHLVGKDSKISGPIAFCYDFDVRARMQEFLSVMNALRPKTLVTVDVGIRSLKIKGEVVQCIDSARPTTDPALREEILVTVAVPQWGSVHGNFDRFISISNSCISDIEQKENAKGCRDAQHLQRSLFKSAGR